MSFRNAVGSSACVVIWIIAAGCGTSEDEGKVEADVTCITNDSRALCECTISKNSPVPVAAENLTCLKSTVPNGFCCAEPGYPEIDRKRCSCASPACRRDKKSGSCYCGIVGNVVDSDTLLSCDGGPDVQCCQDQFGCACDKTFGVASACRNGSRVVASCTVAALGFPTQVCPMEKGDGSFRFVAGKPVDACAGGP